MKTRTSASSATPRAQARGGAAGQSSASQAASVLPGGESAGAADGWHKVPTDLRAELGAMQDYQVRAGERVATARLNGHFQWLLSGTKLLLDFVPEEIKL